ncbi:hypothetical protein KUTeg_014408 [Tegillarca granosa]|uniref:Cilia- and flagella-associated protein 61 N-terminal domain-containing protein n=1 Tax=Tegillarca granosa TaxID=220873 RepID=A0ABQ9EWH3_TEGGR|nr:hypothetical protein KUTeg_014408 [Tegillarca granosa]
MNFCNKTKRKMATTISPEYGPPQVVNARRTESLDAPHIMKLVQDSTNNLFGRVNVVNLIEKAVLAITLCNDKEEILGHAAFFDYPNEAGVDPAEWETWMKQSYDSEKVSPLNSLFMHYFVAKPEYANGCAREIIRTAFNAVPDLHYLFLIVPIGQFPDAALDSLFKQMNKTTDSNSTGGGTIFACERHKHVPVLHLIEAQDEHMQCLVAEVEGTAIGFMSIGDDINSELLNECFELGPFHGLRKPHPDDDLVAPKTPTPSPPPEVQKDSKPPSRSSSKSGSEKGAPVNGEALEVTGSPNGETKVQPKLSVGNLGESNLSLLSDGNAEEAIKEAEERASQASSRRSSLKEEVISSRLPTPKPITPLTKLPKRFLPKYKGGSNAFNIQLSSDFLAKAFALFPNYDFCIITVPHLVPEFPLLQTFVRVTPRCPSTLPQELYVFHRSGLLKDFNVRPACSKDIEGVQKLVQTVDLHENLLADLKQFYKARRDDDGTEIQAFVAECQGQIVGVAILRREENIEYIRSHYNIEDFIYYNHHKREEHGHLYHFAISPIFNHLTKYFIKLLENHSLVCGLNDMVPVRARRQIVYPDGLGINAPSDRVLKNEEAYALNHINRKLVTINARIVVVGASNVGLAFLEAFPHLRFNNLTLISPHGLPGEMSPDEQREQMLTNNFCYNQDDFAKCSLRSFVNVVYGKMTSIDRKKKMVVVNSNTVVPYDHLILSTGQQYQVPAPVGEDSQNSPDARYTGVVPKNLLLINDEYDAAVALYWIENYFVKSSSELPLPFINSDRELINLQKLKLFISCFNNSVVEDAITKALQEAGVVLHCGYILSQWNDGDDVTEIQSASFAFFAYYKKGVDTNAFKGNQKLKIHYGIALSLTENKKATCLLIYGFNTRLISFG